MNKTLPLAGCAVLMAAIAITALVPPATARADILGCENTDGSCVDDIYSARCTERGTTRESCEALARDAEAVWLSEGATLAGELLGLVYFRLSEHADSESVELDYRARSRAVMLAVIAADAEADSAYQMLAVLDHDDTAQRAEWLRRVVAINPRQANIGFLMNALFDLGTRESFEETIAILEAQYAAPLPGTDKWWWAAALLQHLDRSARYLDITVDPAAIEELRSRVRRDSDWERVLTVLASPSANAGDLASALETACRLTLFFGRDPCLDGIERTVLAARQPSEVNAQALADAAARGIEAAPRNGMVVDESLQARRRLHARWLNEFEDFGLDSIRVLEAIGSIAESYDRWIEVRREIVRRIPDDAEARFQLGKVYFDRDRWAEAISEFERARELAPDQMRYQINGYLRQARYELETA